MLEGSGNARTTSIKMHSTGGPIVGDPEANASASPQKKQGPSRNLCICSNTVLIIIIIILVAIIAGGGTGVYFATRSTTEASSAAMNSTDSANTQSPTATAVIDTGATLTKSPAVAPTPATAISSTSPSKPPTKTPTKAPTTRSPTKAPTTKSPTPNPTKTPTIATTTSSPASSPATRFNIDIIYVTSVSTAERTAFEQARARWEEVITKDLASTVYIAKGTSLCGQAAATENIAVDDILIYAEIAPIDGSGKILGSAGPCGFLGNQVRVGSMTFDSADTAAMAQSGTLNSVIMHEMGHVLGLGTLWDMNNLIDPETVTTNIKYYGTQGNIGNTEIGGTGNAIIEDTGGEGTARGHWKETVYQNEIMTGYISGTTQPISRLTVRALVDLGYGGVDVTKADTFTIPSSSGRLRRLRKSSDEFDHSEFHMGDDTYKGAIHYFTEAEPKPGREEELHVMLAKHSKRKHNVSGTNDHT